MRREPWSWLGVDLGPCGTACGACMQRLLHACIAASNAAQLTTEASQTLAQVSNASGPSLAWHAASNCTSCHHMACRQFSNKDAKVGTHPGTFEPKFLQDASESIASESRARHGLLHVHKGARVSPTELQRPWRHPGKSRPGSWAARCPDGQLRVGACRRGRKEPRRQGPHDRADRGHTRARGEGAACMSPGSACSCARPPRSGARPPRRRARPVPQRKAPCAAAQPVEAGAWAAHAPAQRPVLRPAPRG